MELSGCLSDRTTRTRATGAGAPDGTLDVAVYDTPERAKAGVPTAGSVSLDLNRLEKGRPETPVASASEPSASFPSLAPGEYRLQLKAAPVDGSTAAPTITQESLKVAAGETVHTRVILKEFPTRAVVVGVLGTGAGIGIAVAVLNSAFKIQFRTSSLHQPPTVGATKARKRG